jgi:phenylpyruvate tautomerase
VAQYLWTSAALGVSGGVNGQRSQNICQLLSQSLGIAPDRIYLSFTDLNASNYGWNGATFG